MKRIFASLLLVTVITTLHAQFSRASIQASGLTCAMCSKAIDIALKELPYVASVQPDVKNSSFAVVFKQNETADIDGLRKAVEDAGFFVARFTITGNFSNIAI